MAFDVYGRWREKAGLALKQAARGRLEKRDALTATRSERTQGALLSRWRAQGAVAVQLQNFEVYRDCFAGTEKPARPSEAGMSDITAALTGMCATALGALLVTA